MPANVVEVDSPEQFRETTARGTVLVEFYADWSTDCAAVEPALKDLASEQPGLVLARVDVEAHEAVAAEFGVEALPTLVLFADGEAVEMFEGRAPFPDVDRAVAAHR